MTEDEQRELVALISSKQSERQSLLAQLSVLDEEISAYVTDLESARRQAYQDLLDERLAPLNLIYTLSDNEELGTYVLSVDAATGGETELGRLRAALGQDDTSNISTNFMLSYLGASLPWTSL